MNVLAVIPARGGSKSIPRKNLADVAGRPLIAYVIDAAHGAKQVDRTIVTTDDPEIAAVAREAGAETPFERPAELGEDGVDLVTVVRHAMLEMDRLGFRAEIVASVQPTSPFLEASDVDAAIEKLQETGADSVASMQAVLHEHPYWVKKLDGDRVKPFGSGTNESYLQRQDLPPAYIFDGILRELGSVGEQIEERLSQLGEIGVHLAEVVSIVLHELVVVLLDHRQSGHHYFVQNLTKIERLREQFHAPGLDL